jgi:hypothetical protein
MTESQELAKRNGGRQISDDPLAMTITSLVNAMRFDFGHKFKSQFTDDEVLRQYKRRLYAKLRGSDIQDIVDGYDAFITDRPEWPPTVPELCDCVESVR